MCSATCLFKMPKVCYLFDARDSLTLRACMNDKTVLFKWWIVASSSVWLTWKSMHWPIFSINPLFWLYYFLESLFSRLKMFLLRISFISVSFGNAKCPCRNISSYQPRLVGRLFWRLLLYVRHKHKCILFTQYRFQCQNSQNITHLDTLFTSYFDLSTNLNVESTYWDSIQYDHWLSIEMGELFINS